jgi:hypothetical protein
LIANGLRAVGVSAWYRTAGGKQRDRLRTVARNTVDEAVDAALREDAPLDAKKAAKREIRTIAEDNELLDSLDRRRLEGRASELERRWVEQFRTALRTSSVLIDRNQWINKKLPRFPDTLHAVVDIPALIDDLPQRLRTAVHHEATSGKSPHQSWWADRERRGIRERVDRGDDLFGRVWPDAPLVAP